jgi:hypothetical protein
VDNNSKTDVLGSLYLLYKSHVNEISKLGYSIEQAFWLDFACLPFLPWDDQAKDKINLSQVIKLYIGIYQFNTNNSLKPMDIPTFMNLLIDRYKMAKDIVAMEDKSRQSLELGKFALPGEKDTKKLMFAGSIVFRTIIEWQKQQGQEKLPCKLVEDI